MVLEEETMTDDFTDEQVDAYTAGIDKANALYIAPQPEPEPTCREMFPWTRALGERDA